MSKFTGFSRIKALDFVLRSRLKFSWETHYVGDVRAVNCGPIDTYQLKSLDGQLEGDLNNFKITKHKGKMYVDFSDPFANEKQENKTLTDQRKQSEEKTAYDYIIRAIGFKFDRSIFEESIRPKPSRAHSKYPEIKSNYELTSTPNIYVAGNFLMRNFDMKSLTGQ